MAAIKGELMETVSYLTINDETKEIADSVSRNNIHNITDIVTAHNQDIQILQADLGPGGAVERAIGNVNTIALLANQQAGDAIDSIALTEEQLSTFSNAIEGAKTMANQAAYAAGQAYNEAVNAHNSATEAQDEARAATASANVANLAAENAGDAATEALNKANEAARAANQADTSARQAHSFASSAQTSARQANQHSLDALSGLSTLQSVIDTVN